MARYIDADELTAELKLLEMFITGMLCGKTQLTEAVAEYKKSALRLIDEQPTADVAPKSEVDMSQHLLKDAYKRIEELDELCGELQKAKAEVAREIFEEIEKVIGDKYESYVFDNNDFDSIEQDAIINFSDALSDSFEEIKKKYMEEKE